MQIDHYGEVLVGCIDCNRWVIPATTSSSWNCYPTIWRPLDRDEVSHISLLAVDEQEHCCLDVDLMKIGNIPTRPQRGLSLHEHH